MSKINEALYLAKRSLEKAMNNFKTVNLAFKVEAKCRAYDSCLTMLSLVT